MSSRQHRMEQRAARAGVWVVQMPWHGRRQYTVIVDSEGPLGPRDLAISRREAVRLAYLIASRPSAPLRVYETCGECKGAGGWATSDGWYDETGWNVEGEACYVCFGRKMVRA